MKTPPIQERRRPRDEVSRIADEMRRIASLGLGHSTNPYDRESCRHISLLSARLVAGLEDGSSGEALARYQDNLGQIGPILGASAAVFREGRILLIKREDNGLWAAPGGITEVGETWGEAALRELEEEANVSGRVTRLLGVFDARRWGGNSKSRFYQALFLVDRVVGEPVSGPETTDVGFFPEDGLPAMSRSHRLVAPLVFKLNRSEIPVPYFDQVDSEL